ncbi:ion transporter, partial [Phocaeicola vulgatus]
MKLYILIQQLLRRKFVQYFVLFFILISIIAVIASSFEEMATYK